MVKVESGAWIVGAENLGVKYDGNFVFRGANFEVSRGDFVCIVGANGSGKTTLVKTILGLIRPATGKIVYGRETTGKNTSGRGVPQRIVYGRGAENSNGRTTEQRRERMKKGDGRGANELEIGYLPQEMRVEQNFPATVSEVVMSGTLGRLGARAFYRKEDRERVERALKTLGISDLGDKSFSELSGGQRQKVLLARAIVATKELLILDEPSNNLDYRSRKEFYKILMRLNTKLRLTIIMITHDLDVDDLIGNKVLAIRDGAVEMRTTEEYLRSFR